jgi:signal transduction histidine kinase
MDLRERVALLSHLPRRTLRAQITLLYGGVFVVLVAAVLGVTGLLWGTAAHAAPGTPASAIADTQHIIDLVDLHRLVFGFAIACGIAVVLAVALGWLIAGRVLRPLRRITSTARQISATNLHQRLDLKGPDDELKQLGETLDDLFARLESSFEAQRRFAANASHELRTPLTAERSLLQVALADPDASVETWRATGEELLNLGELQERLITSLFTLARSERGIERRESFDLAAIAEQAVLARRQEAERQGISLDADIVEAPIAGDRDLVESLVANLLDNALRHNLEGGRVDITTGVQTGRAVLAIVNTGPLVPPEDVERLFEPFRKAGADRTRSNDGHGLGLAIVRAVADVHGATVIAEPQPSGGLRVGVVFPESSAMASGLALVDSSGKTA